MSADGLMGLSPRIIKSENGEPVTDNFIMKLHESGSIKTPIFSLYLGFTNEKSKMIIGGYDESRIEEKGTKRSAGDENDMTKTEDGIFWM